MRLSNTTLTDLIQRLGLDRDPPIVRSILVAALDQLQPESKREIAEELLLSLRGPAVCRHDRIADKCHACVAERASSPATEVVRDFVVSREEQLSRIYDSPLTQAARGYPPVDLSVEGAPLCGNYHAVLGPCTGRGFTCRACSDR